MHLERIITLANARTRLAFWAMERSLRATGSGLPLAVVPYDETRFDLPQNAEWWEMPDLYRWIESHCAGAHPRGVMRKYQCLLVGGYQYVDTDVVFLRDPAEALAEAEGWVVCCGHWHNPGDTVTEASRAWLAARTTVWQSRVFNTGQFACDRALYDLPGLIARAGSDEFRSTCLENPFHEQMGINLLVNASGVPVTNLTLPPFGVESSWAGDYPGEFEKYWEEEGKRPYLLHWAGGKPDGSRPVDALFFAHLSEEERAEWMAQIAAESGARGWRGRVRRWLRGG